MCCELLRVRLVAPESSTEGRAHQWTSGLAWTSVPTSSRGYLNGIILEKNPPHITAISNLGNEGTNTSPLNESLCQVPRCWFAVMTALPETAGFSETND